MGPQLSIGDRDGVAGAEPQPAPARPAVPASLVYWADHGVFLSGSRACQEVALMLRVGHGQPAGGGICHVIVR
jgi:hypothetical protein